MSNEDRSPEMPDEYDRQLGALHGLPDVAATKASTLRVVQPVLGNSTTYIVATYRQTEEGDTCFVEIVSRSGSQRIVLPPKVTALIARQRDQLAKKVRTRVGKRLAQERKERGEVPFARKAAS
jgi:hypothetical protein